MALDRVLKIGTLRGPSALGMALMIDESARFGGFEITVFDEPVRLLGAMASGVVDYATLPTLTERSLKALGLDFRIAAVMIWGGLYLCGSVPESGPSDGWTPSDLKGKTIHVMAAANSAAPSPSPTSDGLSSQTFTPPEAIIRHLLQKAGLQPDRDVLFDRSFPTHRALAEAASAGRTGLCILSEPFVSQVLESNGRMRILMDISAQWQKTQGRRLPVTALFSRSPQYDGEVISRLRRSCEWVKVHPCAAASAFGSLIPASAIPRINFNVVDYENCRNEITDFLAMW